MRDPRDTYMNTLVPMVVEQTNRGERAYDIFSASAQGTHHLHQRSGRGRDVDPGGRAVAVSGSGQSKKEIAMYINSPGGVVTSG